MLDIIEERSTHLRDFLEGYAHFARLRRRAKRRRVGAVPRRAARAFTSACGRAAGAAARSIRRRCSRPHQPAQERPGVGQPAGGDPPRRRGDREGASPARPRPRLRHEREELKKASSPSTLQGDRLRLGLPLCREIVEATEATCASSAGGRGDGGGVLAAGGVAHSSSRARAGGPWCRRRRCFLASPDAGVFAASRPAPRAARSARPGITDPVVDARSASRRICGEIVELLAPVRSSARTSSARSARRGGPQSG